MFRSRVISVSAVLASAVICAGALAAAGNEDMASLAKAELMNALNHTYPKISDWTVTPLNSDANADVSDKISTATVLQTGARSAVRVRWSDQKGTHSRVIWFDVVGKRNVLVTLRDTPARQAISIADVAIETRDVMATHCSPLQTEEQILGMRAKRALRSGATLCADHVEPQPFVARGEKVQVHYESTQVSLSASGIAQQDGNMGQTLKVLNPSTKDSFTAIVSGIHEVMVHE